MANEGMPINKELIAWARKRAGLSEFNNLLSQFHDCVRVSGHLLGRGC
jgi:hypothetical protein